jgi:hypothetical protein
MLSLLGLPPDVLNAFRHQRDRHVRASGLVASPGAFSNAGSLVGVRVDKDGTRAVERDLLYDQSRRVMLVHRIQRSTEDGQLYDVLIYVVPHKSASLAGVSEVEVLLRGVLG